MTPTTKKILGFSALALAVLGVVVYVKKKNKEEETAKPKTFYATGLTDTAATSKNDPIPARGIFKKVKNKLVQMKNA